MICFFKQRSRFLFRTKKLHFETMKIFVTEKRIFLVSPYTRPHFAFSVHSTLQHTATHCNTLQHTATHCNTLQHTATHCNTLQHTTAHRSTPQHIAQHTASQSASHSFVPWCEHALSEWGALQLLYIETNCNTLHHTASHCITLKHTRLYRDANTLQQNEVLFSCWTL